MSSGSKSSVEADDNPGETDLETVARIKKPRPLTGLPGPEVPATKPKNPRTPLIASPDCRLLEERFRHFIDSCSAEEQEKLRNISVSSADFNFNECSSLPGTPGYKSKHFHIPGSKHIQKDNGGRWLHWLNIECDPKVYASKKKFQISL